MVPGYCELSALTKLVNTDLDGSLGHYVSEPLVNEISVFGASSQVAPIGSRLVWKEVETPKKGFPLGRVWIQ
jgi:hypothetical protein